MYLADGGHCLVHIPGERVVSRLTKIANVRVRLIAQNVEIDYEIYITFRRACVLHEKLHNVLKIYQEVYDFLRSLFSCEVYM